MTRGRKRIGNKKLLNIIVPDDLYNKLRMKSLGMGIHMSELRRLAYWEMVQSENSGK